MKHPDHVEGIPKVRKIAPCPASDGARPGLDVLAHPVYFAAASRGTGTLMRTFARTCPRPSARYE